MKTITRFNCGMGFMKEDSEGEFVTYEDYKKAKAEGREEEIIDIEIEKDIRNLNELYDWTNTIDVSRVKTMLSNLRARIKQEIKKAKSPPRG